MIPTKIAIVFVTDKYFLTPTIFAAAQVSNIITTNKNIDILIFTIDIPVSFTAKITQSFQTSKPTLIPLDRRLFSLKSGSFFNKTHVPHSALGRLAIAPILPKIYYKIIYLDGDIFINNDISSLLTHDPAPGKILAATEGIWLSDRKIEKLNPYMASLGIASPLNYFNSGVFSVLSETWSEMAPKALSFFIKNPEICLYHDQSALNHVFIGNREILSPRYNFTSLYSNPHSLKQHTPAILHFTGKNKPWIYTNPIFFNSHAKIYLKFLKTNPFLIHTIRRHTIRDSINVFFDGVFTKSTNYFSRDIPKKINDYVNTENFSVS